MTDLTNVGAQKASTAEQILSILQDGEGWLGPLVQIGHNKDGTVMVFDLDLDSPSKKAALSVDGEPAVPKGATKVAEGVVYIKNSKKPIVVYRAK